MDREFISIEKEEYDQLLEDQRFLRCLERAGVDNWEGYDIAHEYFIEEE